MANVQKWNLSYSKLAEKWGVKVSALKWWASADGGSHNLNDDDVVRSLVGNARNKTSNQSNTRLGVTVKLNLSNEIGFEGSKKRLQQIEIALGEKYRLAEESGDVNAPIYFKEYLKAQDALKKTETEAPSVSEANRNSITIDAVRVGLGEKLNPLRNGLDSLPKRLCENLPDDLAKIVYNKARKEIDRLIRDIYSLKFLEVSDDQ